MNAFETQKKALEAEVYKLKPFFPPGWKKTISEELGIPPHIVANAVALKRSTARCLARDLKIVAMAVSLAKQNMEGYSRTIETIVGDPKDTGNVSA